MKPMLAKTYKNQNPKGWMMSEKLDGVRAIWDGEYLKSRTGKVFRAPAWFLDGLPKDQILDGELWEGRGAFQKTVGKVRSHQGDWSQIKFMIFDTVTEERFTDRLKALYALNAFVLPPHCLVVDHTVCDSAEHLDAFELALLKEGGEGVMLRQADSLYEHKRSSALLKLKRFSTDEAEVIGYTEGQGKHSGRIGALVCKWAEKVFQVGTGLTDTLRETPPVIGSLITFSYFEATDAGIPRFPSFIAARNYE